MSSSHAINTERLTLKRVSPDDAGLSAAGYVPLHRRSAPVSAEVSLDFAPGYISTDASPVYGWSFALRSDPDRPIGYFGLHNCNKQEGSCDLQLHLSHGEPGLVHASEALNVLISYCFLLHFPFPLKRITAMVAAQDQLKRTMLMELGFREKIDQDSLPGPAQQASLVLSFMDWELHQRVSF